MPKFTSQQIIEILKSWKKRSSLGAREGITIPCSKKMNWKIPDWMQGKLSVKQDRAFTEHLRECWVCREWLSQYKSYNPEQKKAPAVIKPGLVKGLAGLIRLLPEYTLIGLRPKWQFVTAFFASPLRASLATAAMVMVFVLAFLTLGGADLFFKPDRLQISLYGEIKDEPFWSRLWDGIKEADIYQFKLFEKKDILIWKTTTRDRIFPSNMPPLTYGKEYRLKIEALTNEEVVSTKEFTIKFKFFIREEPREER